MTNLSKEYGPIYTIWICSKPIIIINDLKLANEAFIVKGNQLAGRPSIGYCKYKTIFISKFKSILFTVRRTFQFHNASSYAVFFMILDQLGSI